MKYYAKLTPQPEGGYLVEFPELRGCLTEGDSRAKALHNASEALDGWLEAHFNRTQSVPLPKVKRGKNFYPIKVDPQIALAIVLRRTRGAKRLSQAQVAKKLGISQRDYARLELLPSANPPLSTVSKLADILGIDINFDLAS